MRKKRTPEDGHRSAVFRALSHVDTYLIASVMICCFLRPEHVLMSEVEGLLGSDSLSAFFLLSTEVQQHVALRRPASRPYLSYVALGFFETSCFWE